MNIKEALAELKEAQWIGEDGNMTCVSSTKLGAMRKFKKLYKDTDSSLEADEITEDNISIGWLHLVSELTDLEKRKSPELADCDWYVSYKEKSPYEVWVFQL